LTPDPCYALNHHQHENLTISPFRTEDEERNP
jgi:hypothetical protein